jgi:hypothetical protein
MGEAPVGVGVSRGMGARSTWRRGAEAAPSQRGGHRVRSSPAQRPPRRGGGAQPGKGGLPMRGQERAGIRHGGGVRPGRGRRAAQ